MAITNQQSGTNVHEIAEGIYPSHTKHARPMLERLAAANPTTLACMHGSAWRGDGASLLRGLADALSA